MGPKEGPNCFNCHGPSATNDESMTILYPWNKVVKRVNDERLKAMEQEIVTFTAEDKNMQILS